MAPIPLTWGCASIHSGGSFTTTSAIQDLFAVLWELGITHLDSAQLYGDCEKLLGQAGVATHGFTIDSKTPGGWVPGMLAPGRLAADLEATLAHLGVAKLDTFFIHGPDPAASLPDALHTLDEQHRQGRFARLGLSNFTADEVETVHRLCAEHGWLAPTVYQGSYSAFARRPEVELMTTLRRLGISFSAYSPLAGGFLARRDAAELAAPASGGRFAVDPADPEGENGGLGLYRRLYSSRPKLVAALAKWGSIADEAGCSCPAEMAYRWVVWDSALDASKGDRVTIGASRTEQLQKTTEWVAKGSLGTETAANIDALWKEIEDAAPLDNMHM